MFIMIIMVKLVFCNLLLTANLFQSSLRKWSNIFYTILTSLKIVGLL